MWTAFLSRDWATHEHKPDTVEEDENQIEFRFATIVTYCCLFVKFLTQNIEACVQEYSPFFERVLIFSPIQMYLNKGY